MKPFCWVAFLAIVGVTTCFGQRHDPFLDKVLDFQQCRSCYFLLVDVSSDVYSGRALVENDDFMRYLAPNTQSPDLDYKKVALHYLEGKQKVEIADAQITNDVFLESKKAPDVKFGIVTDHPEVNSLSALGCVRFVKHYFSADDVDSTTADSNCSQFIEAQKRTLFLSKAPISVEEQNALVAKLFEWRIPVRMDHMSGRLVIDAVVANVPSKKP